MQNQILSEAKMHPINQKIEGNLLRIHKNNLKEKVRKKGGGVWGGWK